MLLLHSSISTLDNIFMHSTHPLTIGCHFKFSTSLVTMVILITQYFTSKMFLSIFLSNARNLELQINMKSISFCLSLISIVMVPIMILVFTFPNFQFPHFLEVPILALLCLGGHKPAEFWLSENQLTQYLYFYLCMCLYISICICKYLYLYLYLYQSRSRFHC